MNVAGAEKLARRLHRGDIDESRSAYVDHLQRVAALVDAAHGDECEQMAAWLHGTSQAGLSAADLAGRKVPRRVIRIIAAITPAPRWEPAQSQARRISSCPGAALVLRADVADLCRPEAGRAGLPESRCDHYRQLLALLGEPVPQAWPIASLRPVIRPMSRRYFPRSGRARLSGGTWSLGSGRRAGPVPCIR